MPRGQNVTAGALQRRLARKAGHMNPGQFRGGSRQLAPGNTSGAGSMLNAGSPEGGRGKVSRRLARGLGR